MIQLTENSIAMEVPGDAYNFEIYDNNVIGGWCVMFLRGVPDYDCCYTGNLPEGNWSILGKPGEMTEELKKLIVDKHYDQFGTWYKDYSENHLWALHINESWDSLFKSKSIDQSKVIILIKKQ